MKIQIDRAEFLLALKRAGAAVKHDGDMIYKSCVLVIAGPHGITLNSTNATLHVLSRLKGEVKEDGRAVLTHRKLTNIVNELPPGLVELAVDDKLRVKVTSVTSKRKFMMTAHEADAFPAVLEIKDEAPLFAIESKIFQHCAGEVAFSIDNDGHYIKAALLVPIDNTRFRLVTISGWSFAASIGWFTKSESSESILLPGLLLSAASVLPSDSTEILVHGGDRRVVLVTPDTTIACDQLAGNFPQIEGPIMDSIPKEKRFRVSSEKMLESVRAVSVAAEFKEGKEGFVQVDVSYKNGACSISTRKTDKSFGEDELHVTDGSETECVIHMDAGKLSQALRAFVPADIDVYYNSINSQELFFLRNENLTTMLLPVGEVKAKGG